MPTDRLAWVDSGGTVARLVVGQPILTASLLAELRSLLADLPAVPLMISSTHPRIFLAGAHLGEIAGLDRDTSREYANRGREVMRRLGSHPAPVVAAVNGSCAGGGFDLALSCDAIVAGPAATFAHPGVARGLVTGWGGTLALRQRTGAGLAAAILLQARPLTAAEIAAMGSIRPVLSDPIGAAIAEARRLACLHPSRVRLWRSFRCHRFVDSFRAFVVHNDQGVSQPGLAAHGGPSIVP
jgi:enoyl-CoA hydratase/carnithine racemase